MGWCRETYTFGTQFVVINISYLLSTPIAAYIFLPVFYRLQSASVYKSVTITSKSPHPHDLDTYTGIWSRGLAAPPACWPLWPSLCR